MSIQDDITAGKVDVSLGQLMEDAYAYLYREEERPRPVFIGSNDLSNPGEVVFTLADPTLVHTTDLLEYGHELMLVTAKSDDADPEFTVQREYANTPNEGVALTGAALLKQPRWKRHQVWRALLQGLNGTIRNVIPMTEQASFPVDESWVALPTDTLGVTRVGWTEATTYDQQWIDGWSFERDQGADGLGIGIRLSTRATRFTPAELLVRRAVPNPTTGPGDGEAPNATLLPQNSQGEAYTVRLWQGTEDVVALWAAAFRLLGREMSRVETNTMQEWNNESYQRQNVNLRSAQFLWQTFYARLDEVRGMYADTYRRRKYFQRRGTGYSHTSYQGVNL